MNTKSLVIILVIAFLVLVGIVVYFVLFNSSIQSVQNAGSPDASPDKLEIFNQATSKIGLGGANISDEKIIPGGAQPYYMRIGFPYSVDYKNGKYFLNIDLALWFNGDNADLADKEDGDEFGVPNGYYIRNENNIIKTFEISPSAPIYMIEEGSGEPKSIIHIAEFKSLLEQKIRINYAQSLPFVFDLDNNIITRAYQHYVP